jgi:hypothetical protein
MEVRHNRHPADELADVRAEIRAAQVREAELRAVLLDGACGREGADFVARVAILKQARLDIEAAKKHLGAALKPFMIDKEMRKVRLDAKEGQQS